MFLGSEVAHNGGVDAAARIKAPFAVPSKLRNTLPPLASNDLLCSALPQEKRKVNSDAAVDLGTTTGIRAFNHFPRPPLVLISSHQVPSGNCSLIEHVFLSTAVSRLCTERPPSLTVCRR